MLSLSHSNAKAHVLLLLLLLLATKLARTVLWRCPAMLRLRVCSSCCAQAHAAREVHGTTGSCGGGMAGRRRNTSRCG